ncbi:MAG: NUDIX domain-containing protein [Bacillota bacterium]|nr:NUDIX domain-containing protein [Bacillota bacterium]
MPAKPFALSVKVLIKNDEDKYLLLRRSSISKYNAGKWEMPGGKIEPCENFDKALTREVAEETGLTVTMLKVAGAAQSESPDKMIAYLIMEGVSSSIEVILSPEHDSFKWLNLDELGSMDLAKQFKPFITDFISSKRSR